LQRVSENIRRYGIDVVVAFGGEDTLGVAKILHNELGIPVVGWPKTMDNDQRGSYSTIGYIKAAYIAATSTLEALATAYTHSRIVLIPVFGRNTDWVVGAAADYGLADYVIPAERKGLTLNEVSTQIRRIYDENRVKHGRPFAVVVVSEAASNLGGLKRYIEKILPPGEIKYDSYGHPKLEPEILAYALKQALSEGIGVKMDGIAAKPLTYHLRDGKLWGLDERFARMTAEECVRLIDEGNFGRVATIQDPHISGFWPDDPTRYADANGRRLVVSSVPLDLAAQVRPVLETGFLDYTGMAPTQGFTIYLSPLLGQKPQNPRDRIIPFKAAEPIKS
jgi:6-phosphofructokinase